MKEELITSGRMNPGIDPSLSVWHWPIASYLFLGGLAAGLIFFAAYYVIMGKENEFKTTVKIAPIFAPIALALGLILLLFDLHHILYAWQLFTTIRIESPMSWGAWTLLIITPLSIAWIGMYLKDINPKINLNGCCASLL